MSYEPHEIEIDITDVRPTIGGFRWANVELKFADQEHGVYPHVRAHVLVSSDLSLSIRELRAQAGDQTKSILRAALSHLEELGPEGWASRQDEREAREAEALDASLKGAGL